MECYNADFFEQVQDDMKIYRDESLSYNQANLKNGNNSMTLLIRISLIITTYNWPSALDRILHSVEKQQGQCEVIVADDGSTDETRTLVTKWQKQLPFLLRHVWQPDAGFCAGQIRNKAAALAQGNYLVFIDGDCIPAKNFIDAHLHLAQPHCFVAGQRILLSKAYTQAILNLSLDVSHHHRWFWFKQRCRSQCNRWLPMVRLPGH